jgi:phage tail sheath protein FI
MSVTPTFPGVFIGEIPSDVRTIPGISTSIAAFIGRALAGPVNQAVTINGYSDFERIFGGLWLESTLGHAVSDFFLNGGSEAIIVRLRHAESENDVGPQPDFSTDEVALTAADFLPDNAEQEQQGLYALDQADLFNILCLPPYLATGDVDPELISAAAAYCEKRRAMLLIDPPSDWTTKDKAKIGMSAGVGTSSMNAAIYFPRLKQQNTLRDNQLENFVPCGAVAGVYARTDAQHGVWKAPAGLVAALKDVPALSLDLTDAENRELNPLAINCLRTMPMSGRVIWGGRTLQGADGLNSEWKYVPVRRTALFIEESIDRGTKWVRFGVNDELLWAEVRLNVGTFMHGLFRQGAFQGTTPKDAYLVRCDKETTSSHDIDLGIMNIVVGFAPLKPAEFVTIRVQQRVDRAWI